MPPLAEIEERLPGKLAMLFRHRLDSDAGAADEGFGLPHAVGAELSFDHHRQLEIVRHTHAADIGVLKVCKELRFFFAV